MSEISLTSTAKYNTRDLILYALSLNCKDEKYVFEKCSDFQPFPTFIASLVFKGESDDVQLFPPPSMLSPFPKILKDACPLPDRDPVTIHVAQKFVFSDGFELPVPSLGSCVEIEMKQKVVKIAPKSIGAFVTTKTDYFLKSNGDNGNRTLCCQGFSTALCLGIPPECVNTYSDEKYFTSKKKGKQVSSRPNQPMHLNSALVFVASTNRSLPLLYRVASGDYNIIHVKKTGENPPIVHGLCTLGITIRAIMEKMPLARNQVVKMISVDFTSPVPLGSSLKIHTWKHGDSKTILFDVYVNKKIVLRNGTLEMGHKKEQSINTI